MKTLQRRLLGSHLLVMAVAVGVLVGGALLVGGLIEIVGSGRRFDPTGRGQGGPIVPLAIIGAALVAASVVSWSVSRTLAEPLERIGAATRELAAGRYEAAAPGADTFEVDALASDVNVLAQELRTTEQRRLRLIGDVAHELRNPLSTIEGTMEALLDGVVDASDETFARIGREAARLRRLADDLSSLSSAGEPSRFDYAMLDLSEVVADVVAQLDPQARAKDLRLTLSENPPAVNVLGDRDRLTQVFTNVIGNALQYTDNGTIDIRFTSDADASHVSVTDTGRGLAAEDQRRIFERFHRVDDQFSDGTGVGLAIATLIVEAHGGEIKASSGGLGQGTTVDISLPLPPGDVSAQSL